MFINTNGRTVQERQGSKRVHLSLLTSCVLTSLIENGNPYERKRYVMMGLCSIYYWISFRLGESNHVCLGTSAITYYFIFYIHIHIWNIYIHIYGISTSPFPPALFGNGITVREIYKIDRVLAEG